MKRESVPQDHAKAFMGLSKVLYAEDADGRCLKASSDGWEAEEIVLDQAIEEFQRQARQAWTQAREGRGSTLAYHMYCARMDEVVLAQSAGYSRWRVRRHLRPGVFVNLSEAIRQRYADALGMTTPEELDILPDQP